MIAEKIARGCEYHYKKRRRYIEAPYGVRTLIRKSEEFDRGAGTVCEVLDLGPGCKITRIHHPQGDPHVAAYFISMWGALHLTALIDFENELQRLDRLVPKADGILPPEGRAMRVPEYLRRFTT
jgi:hypothetical protein